MKGWVKIIKINMLKKNTVPPMTLKKLERLSLSLSLLQFFAQKSNWICQEFELNYHRFSPWNAEICTHFDWSVVTIFWRKTHWWPHHCFRLFIIKSNKHVVVGLYSNRSQRTSKCDKTIGEKTRCSAICVFSVSRKTYKRCYYPNWSKPVRNLSLALCQNAPKISLCFSLNYYERLE